MLGKITRVSIVKKKKLMLSSPFAALNSEPVTLIKVLYIHICINKNISIWSMLLL